MEENNGVTKQEQSAGDVQENTIQGKQKGKAGKTFLKVIVWILVIAFILWLTLFLSAKIAKFENIPAMLEFIKSQI